MLTTRDVGWTARRRSYDVIKALPQVGVNSSSSSNRMCDDVAITMTEVDASRD